MMTNREYTVTKRLQALVVEIIRRLWDHKLYRDNKWLKMIHDNWLSHWLDVKTNVTMRSVDRQAEALTPEPEVISPLRWEEDKGETPLGGSFGYKYEFSDDPKGVSDSND